MNNKDKYLNPSKSNISLYKLELTILILILSIKALVQNKIIEQIQLIGNQEVEDILNGMANFTLVYTQTNYNSSNLIKSKQSKPSKSDKKIKQSNKDESNVIVEKLEGFSNREDGLKFLEELSLTKENLQKLAKSIDIPIFNNYTKQQLIEKIIEQTIGYRLRSQAIQGKTNKGDESITKIE